MTRRRILWWFLLPLLTFGTATFAVVGYAGWRLRSGRHFAAAAGYFLLYIGISVHLQVTGEEFRAIDAIVLPLYLVNWLVGSAHAGWLERKIKVGRAAAQPSAPPDPAVLEAQQRLIRRNEARALVTSNPALAAELRIGRPDLRRHYDDGGLVDVNHVSAEMITWELEIPSLVAEEIVVQRTRVGGLYSADDLIVYCETVTPHQMAIIRDRLLFTPV